MSRKWLEKEAPGWVKQEIINEAQANKLLALYDERKHAAGLLPILGSILVTLGLLTFVAANWQYISPGMRLAFLVIVMTGFYAGGEWLQRRGAEKLGIALTGIGVASFGGALLLIYQTFHIMDYHVTAFLLWGIAAIVCAFVYRSGFLYVMAAVIVNAAQMYSLTSFNSFSIPVFAATLIGLGAYWWFHRKAWQAWLLGIAFLLQMLMLVIEREWHIVWFLAPALLLYAAADWLRDRQTAYPLQSSVLTAFFVFAALQLMIGGDMNHLQFKANELVELLSFMAVVLAALVISLTAKWRQQRKFSFSEWILLLPWFLLPVGAEVVSLLALCLFSLYLLADGYALHWRFKINLGTGLFLFAVLLAYTRLAWRFMDKSLFFLIGGILLLLLSWLLHRRRQRALQSEGGEQNA
ncbi:DUF2157 domain-containing protein [Paenibacillaceae bacterium]|nr:DUF2157 domain-containing protein [Paenibacillaceae bacterium]